MDDTQINIHHELMLMENSTTQSSPRPFQATRQVYTVELMSDKIRTTLGRVQDPSSLISGTMHWHLVLSSRSVWLPCRKEKTTKNLGIVEVCMTGRVSCTISGFAPCLWWTRLTKPKRRNGTLITVAVCRCVFWDVTFRIDVSVQIFVSNGSEPDSALAKDAWLKRA